MNDKTLLQKRLSRYKLNDIAEKVETGERLSFQDGVALYNTPDLLSLGAVADMVRRRQHGNTTFFNRNMHLNYSNICALKCKFCAFRKDEGEEQAYRFDLDEVRRRLEAVKDIPLTEVHIVGGLDGALPWEYYIDMLKLIKEMRPEIRIKAFTSIELDFFCRKFRKSIDQVLDELLEAGLDTIPGGGAEVFSESVRSELFKSKPDVNGWLTVSQAAHRKGIKTNATLLYGHIESVEDRVNHMVTLRQAQDETGGFQAFIPLAFHPENTELAHLPGTTGYLDLRTIAVSRLMLDNIPHIKAYWVMLGTKVAQLAQSFGANDLDGTVTEETIVKMAGGKTRGELSTEEIIHLIHDAGFDAVERDSVYNVVAQYPREVNPEQG